jgi:ferredoxin
VIVVVGSGPAGVACAGALLDRGCEVTMVDVGLELEPARRSAVAKLAAGAPEEWPDEELASWRRSMAPGPAGIPTKTVYGSDFPYREAEDGLGIRRRGAGGSASFARGGFGNVWGAVTVPYRADDLDGWPFGAEALAPHYEAVLRDLPLSGVEDDLADLRPLHALGRPLPVSRQAEAFLADAHRRRDALARAGLSIGRARLAVRAAGSERDPGCVTCGLCLYGCPYGLIHNPATTLDRLRGRPGFRYLDGVVVERVAEHPRGVTLTGRGHRLATPWRFDAERVFLAAGLYATTRIVLASLGAYDRPVEILDSQYFLLPLVRLRGAGAVERERLHTLAQALIDLRDAKIDHHTVHFEVFGYNDLLPRAAAARLGRLAPLARGAVRRFLRRALVLQGYLHSDVSPRLRATLVREPAGEALRIEGVPNPRARPVIRRAVRRLLVAGRALGALPIPMLVEIAAPGRSYRSGGAFPMRAHPGPLDSDLWGRPHGFERVHAVDASVLPSVPSSAITLPVMANAHRIASTFEAD